MIRKRIRFYGSVQGVGFRYRARHAADMYGCTGWAKNEYDGSVSMEIQGEEEAIDRVIMSIESGTYVRIDNISAETIELDESERKFVTR